MKNLTTRLALPICAGAMLSLTGCATYTIQPVAAKDLRRWNADNLGRGYVFYQPELYFLVTATPAKTAGDAPPADGAAKILGGDPKPAPGAAPTLTVTPIYLPNPGKPYRITTFNLLAKSDFTFNFKDGWQLTSIADKADNSGVATALVGQIKTALDAIKTFNATNLADKQPKTFLLHPEFNDDGIITRFKLVPVPDLGQ